jgi:hypothetical protein
MIQATYKSMPFFRKNPNNARSIRRKAPVFPVACRTRFLSPEIIPGVKIPTRFFHYICTGVTPAVSPR